MPHSTAVRCAIYTRKSVSDRFAQEYNSLEAQRDICEAYIRTQRDRRWMALETNYCDDGASGATMARPQLERLMADIERGFVDVVVIYKIDRLTRSLADFVRLIDMFEQYGVTFVSVTQSFDTQESMGRLILNILLTFAQFEREMLADRIRDKMIAMKRAGRWTGGPPPLGYDVVDGKLVVNDEEAIVVRSIFEQYLEVGSYRGMMHKLQAAGIRSKRWVNRAGVEVGGGLASKGMTWSILKNRVYVGEVAYKDEVFEGLHEPIVARDVWEAAQSLMESRKILQPPVNPVRNLLAGLMFDGVGRRMKINNGRKGHTQFRYYISDQSRAQQRQKHKLLRVKAEDLEALVRVALCSFLRDRFAVGKAILSLGHHEPDTQRLIDAGPVAARRLEAFDNRRLRLAYESLFQRVDITREEVRIVVRCDQLYAFLGWSGIGLFRGKASENTCVHMLEIEAKGVRNTRSFFLPIEAASDMMRCRPNKSLVDLLGMARDVQTTIYGDRTLSMADVAKRICRKPAFTARLMRLNYLAPDIVAAILDGRQPPDLTRKKLVFSSLPMDWALQRAMLGFPAQSDPSPRDVHY